MAAHHSALDARRRREVEAALKEGRLRAVVTSTSLELGVDIGTADLTVQVGLPGGVARCVQRVGRSGHRVGAASRGLMLAATPAELAGAVVTARAAEAGRVEPLQHDRRPARRRLPAAPGMACAGEWAVDEAFALVRKAAPMAELTRADFDACLDFLAGELAAPPGAFEPEPGAAPALDVAADLEAEGLVRRPEPPRRSAGSGATSARSPRRSRCGCWPTAWRSARSRGPTPSGSSPGDRFVLDGRASSSAAARARSSTRGPSGGEPGLPSWPSDRQSLSAELARELAEFRAEGARRLARGRPARAPRLADRGRTELDPEAAAVLVELFEAQERLERGARA